MTMGRKITDAKKVKDLDPKGRAKDVKGGSTTTKLVGKAKNLVRTELKNIREGGPRR